MPSTWGFVSDVDGTWTHRQLGALVRVVDDRVLPPAANRQLIKLREQYSPLGRLGRLTREQEIDWLRRTLDLYITHRVTRSAWQAALADVGVRAGLAETYAWCAAVGMPSCAVSFGCADFIEYVAARNGVRLDAVYASRLQYDEDGVVVGYDEASILIPEEKGVWSRRFADERGIAHDRLIGVGDTGGDRHIGHLQEHRLGIAESEEDAESLRGLGIMGEVHVSMTFDPILAAIKRRVGLP